MPEIRKIICPNTQKVLILKYVPGIEDKSLKCPECGQIHKYTDCKELNETAANDTETKLGNISSQKIGRIYSELDNQLYELKVGENIIGRRSPSSKAGIQVTNLDNRMSRSHFAIDVAQLPAAGYVYSVSLTPGEKNRSYVNGHELKAGDEFRLTPGDTLRVGGTTVKLVLDDQETIRKKE